MPVKKILTPFLALIFLFTSFVFFATTSVYAQLWGDTCYCSDGDYYYHSYNGTEGTDYGWTNNSGWCNLDLEGEYSDWMRTNCDDPYGQGNYAYWDILSYPDYSENLWNTVYAYIPSDTSTATGAKYSFTHYQNWPAGWPSDPNFAYFTVNQSNYSNQWIHFRGWYRVLDYVSALGYTSCPADQQFNTDDIVGRYCLDFDEETMTCEASGFPSGFSPPDCPGS